MSDPVMPSAGIPIEDPKQLSAPDLLERLQAATVKIQELQRSGERRVAEEKDRAKMDLERLRGTTAAHVRDVEAQNVALVKSITRIQNTLDAMERELIELRAKASIRDAGSAS